MKLRLPTENVMYFSMLLPMHFTSFSSCDIACISWSAGVLAPQVVKYNRYWGRFGFYTQFQIACVVRSSVVGVGYVQWSFTESVVLLKRSFFPQNVQFS